MRATIKQNVKNTAFFVDKTVYLYTQSFTLDNSYFSTAPDRAIIRIESCGRRQSPKCNISIFFMNDGNVRNHRSFLD